MSGETMLDRMARAIADDESPYRPGTHNAERWWLDMDEGQRGRYMATAKAALLAIRDIPDTVAAEAAKRLPAYLTEDSEDWPYASAVFATAIDSILNEEA